MNTLLEQLENITGLGKDEAKQEVIDVLTILMANVDLKDTSYYFKEKAFKIVVKIQAHISQLE